MATEGGSDAITITRTHAKNQALLEAGAADVIVSDDEDIAERLMAITARGGILLEYGALSSEPTPFPLFTVLGKSLTLKGYLYAEIVSDQQILARAKAFILEGLKTGALRPVIAKTFALEQIQEALRFLESPSADRQGSECPNTRVSARAGEGYGSRPHQAGERQGRWG
nr:zinc-binding dehydrogenase [Pseudomonas fluorescens]